MSTGERGFALLDALIAAALFALAAAASAGVVAAIARATTPGIVRDAARTVAENVLTRANAAVAYAAAPAPGSTPASDRNWALTPGASSFVAGAALVSPLPCGSTVPLQLRLPVSTSFDPATQRFTVTVSYPRDPCDASGPTATVEMAQTLPPSAYAPGSTVDLIVRPPARM
jgi:hypothetical protein